MRRCPAAHVLVTLLGGSRTAVTWPIQPQGSSWLGSVFQSARAAKKPPRSWGNCPICANLAKFIPAAPREQVMRAKIGSNLPQWHGIAQPTQSEASSSICPSSGAVGPRDRAPAASMDESARARAPARVPSADLGDCLAQRRREFHAPAFNRGAARGSFLRCVFAKPPPWDLCAKACCSRSCSAPLPNCSPLSLAR